VASFRLQVKASLPRIPHFLTAHILNLDVGFKDSHGIISISFIWPDVTSTLSPLSHFETQIMRALVNVVTAYLVP
jgi:hypothetical protein